MEIGISERFPSMDPVRIRRTRAAEIFLLIRRLNEYTEREKAEKGNGGQIDRPASDTWF